MPKMILMFGEKDGLGQDGELTISAQDRPDIFFAVPNADDEKIRSVKGNQARREMRDKLAVLAYKFDPEHSTKDKFVMVRYPAGDKVSHNG